MTAADRPSVTDNARAAGRAALDAYESIPYDNDMSDEDVWDRMGAAALAAGRTETTTATLLARKSGETQALIESLLAQANERGLTVEVVYPETTTATTEDVEENPEAPAQAHPRPSAYQQGLAAGRAETAARVDTTGMVVGDPDPWQDDYDSCDADLPTFICTAPVAHAGPHVGTDGERVMGVGR